MNVSDKSWVTAGINLDEDIHFSTTYLRMTINSNNGKVFKGYSSLIAYYSNFNEEYFLLIDECRTLAEQLIEKIRSDSKWFDDILSEIMIRSRRLHDCFSDEKCTQNYFHMLSNNELRDIYSKQYNLTISLYEYARIPEILDRGINYFTNYLLDYLNNLVGKDMSQKVFFKLIETSQSSIYKQSEIDLQNMVEIILSEHCDQYSKRFFRLYLSSRVKEMIRAYTNKWKYLEYHGYGNRNLLTEDDVILRLALLAEKTATLKNIKNDDEHRYLEKTSLPEIPKDILNLFHIYPQISIVKLFRKYIQNRNFYFLDLIISELSQRWQVEEAVIRSMLPEEIMQALSAEKAQFDIIRKRIPRCIFELNEKGEKIITDTTEIEEKLRVIRAKYPEKNNDHELVGYPVSPGRVIGRTVTVYRKEDAQKHLPGDIILSDSADPDIFYAITDAGALLTVQGGTTSHAGLYCREMKIPAITGLKNLLSIKDGTLVEIDAYIGKVTIIESAEADNIAIGNKAMNLLGIQKFGFFVPKFKTLNFQQIFNAYRNGNLEQQLSTLRLEQNKKYIIRSSAIDEDGEEQSNVGKYVSIPGVNSSNFINSMESFVTQNAAKEFEGGIIVQEMLPFEYCGVTVTSGVHSNEMIIEFCEGEKNYITEGIGEIGRIVFNKDKDEIIEMSNPYESINREQLYSHINTFKKIEQLWGTDADIEWGDLKGRLFILQIRSIVKHQNEANH